MLRIPVFVPFPLEKPHKVFSVSFKQFYQIKKIGETVLADIKIRLNFLNLSQSTPIYLNIQWFTLICLNLPWLTSIYPNLPWMSQFTLIFLNLLLTHSIAHRITPHRDFNPTQPNPIHPSTYKSKAYLPLYIRDGKPLHPCKINEMLVFLFQKKRLQITTNTKAKTNT